MSKSGLALKAVGIAGKLGFAFFLVKGMVWLAIFAAAAVSLVEK